MQKLRKVTRRWLATLSPFAVSIVIAACGGKVFLDGSDSFCSEAIRHGQAECPDEYLSGQEQFNISLCEDGATFASEAGCFEQYRAFFTCFAGSPLDCDNAGTPTACDAEKAALDGCSSN